MPENLPPTDPDNREVVITPRGPRLEATPPDSSDTQTRRTVLRWIIRASYAAFALAFALPALALRTLTRQTKGVAAGDTLVYAAGKQSGSPVSAGDLQPESSLQAFPQGKTTSSDNLIELVRLAGNSPDIVAYSAICTHLGCSVLPHLTKNDLIACPCHGSIYNPAKDAAVVHGPAGRPLPSLPIKVNDDGTIVATGGFSGPIGPQ